MDAIDREYGVELHDPGCDDDHILRTRVRPVTTQLQAPGLYARLEGVDYRLVSRGAGWVLQTDRVTPGFEKAPFTKGAGVRYERKVDPGEQLECVRLSYTGSYRNIPVSVAPSTEGRVMVTTKDPQAREDGFEGFERDEWVKLIPADDRDLHIVVSQIPVPAPWLRSGRRLPG